MVEDTIIPASVDSKMVQLNIILENMLVVLHFKIVDSIFSISSGINRAKPSMEGMGKGGPIVHPFRSVIRLKNRQLKVVKSSTTEVRQGEGDLWFIIRVGGIVVEIEVAEEDEVIELLRVRTVHRIEMIDEKIN